MPTGAPLGQARSDFHQELSRTLLAVKGEQEVAGRIVPVWSNADGHSNASVGLAAGMEERMAGNSSAKAARGSTSGAAFENAVLAFLSTTLPLHSQLDGWELHVAKGSRIDRYSQYAHLREIQRLVRENPELEAAVGGDYLVDPDLVAVRIPLSKDRLEAAGMADPEDLSLSPIRGRDDTLPILHASISCKWTIRSDRVQNTRTEALNLVRNRKGRTPHIVAVTAEPLPGRLAAIAAGTGDIDCVYHAALPELRDAAKELSLRAGGEWGRVEDRLERMIFGSRLRDISDLPLDLLA